MQFVMHPLIESWNIAIEKMKKKNAGGGKRCGSVMLPTNQASL